MKDDLNTETRKRILNEFAEKQKNAARYRLAAVILLLVSVLLMKRKGFLWYLSAAGFFAAAFLLLISGIYKYERSRCPFCGSSLGYMSSKTDYRPRSCPKCGEKL